MLAVAGNLKKNVGERVKHFYNEQSNHSKMGLL